MKAYRFEFQIYDEHGYPTDEWGWDVVEAPNYTSAKKWIFETYSDYEINYIAELKYERKER